MIKIQDVLFVIVLVVVLWRRSPKVAASLGIICLLLAIPLFAKQIFFTAEHLVWYAAGFFLVALFIFLYQLRKDMIKR